MKATRINQWGQSPQIEDVLQPVPARDEVLVRIHSASLNPVDSYCIAGYFQTMQQLPFTPGTDFSGDVVSIGADITHVKPGDAVFGMIPIRGGAFAEYAVPKANEVAAKPQSLDYQQASAVPLAVLAAWQTLIDFAQVQSGERVLILGAGGSVGSFAVQLAKNKGAIVITSDLPGKETFLQSLGVDQIINAATTKFENVVGKVDIVLNYATPELQEASYSVLNPGGRYATGFAQPSQEEADRLGIRAFGVATHPTIEHLRQVAQMVDAGKLKVFVQRVFPLDEIQKALAYRQTVTQPGKVVLSIANL
jgi:NADPH:quinone reductase-like Zn-dependent oxidoreductase